MNDDLHLDPANTSSEPETLKALVTAPRPSRERYPYVYGRRINPFVRQEFRDEFERCFDELDSNQAEIARLTGKLEWMRRENGELYDDAAANATRADKAQAESDRLRAEVDRLTADVAARDETIAALVLWTPFRDDEAEDLTDAVGAPVEGEPQHD